MNTLTWNFNQSWSESTSNQSSNIDLSILQNALNAYVCCSHWLLKNISTRQEQNKTHTPVSFYSCTFFISHQVYSFYRRQPTICNTTYFTDVLLLIGCTHKSRCMQTYTHLQFQHLQQFCRSKLQLTPLSLTPSLYCPVLQLTNTTAASVKRVYHICRKKEEETYSSDLLYKECLEQRDILGRTGLLTKAEGLQTCQTIFHHLHIQSFCDAELFVTLWFQDIFLCLKTPLRGFVASDLPPISPRSYLCFRDETNMAGFDIHNDDSCHGCLGGYRKEGSPIYFINGIRGPPDQWERRMKRSGEW